MSIAVTPKCYQNAVLQFPQSFLYYEQLNLIYSPQDSYRICEKLGYGKYSDVFKGYKDSEETPVVIKILKPVKFIKVYREVKILTNLLGGPHIMQLRDITRVLNSDYPAFITEFGGTSFQMVMSNYMIDKIEMRLYMAQLLLALDYCHQHGIVHRDVKGGNICVDLLRKNLTLLDFGLAEFYTGKPLHHRVATRHYKSPELLAEYQLYDYSLDIWSAATMLAGYVFKQQPFFRGSDNSNQLAKIVEVLGSRGLQAMLQKYKIELPTVRAANLSGYNKVPLGQFVTPDNQVFCDDHTIAFLEACLQYDPEMRPTARECLKMEYFSPILRQLADIEIQRFTDIERHVKNRFSDLPEVVMMSVKHEDNIQWPVPISPNEICSENIFDQSRWERGWRAWQDGLCQRGSSLLVE